MSHQLYKKCLTFGAGCSLLFTSFLPQAVSAGQVVQFTLDGVLESMDELTTPWYPRFDGTNVAGATLSGFVNVDLDFEGMLARSASSSTYALDDWSLQLKSNGRTVNFNPTDDAREHSTPSLLRLSYSSDTITFRLISYEYAGEVDEYGYPLGAPWIGLTFNLPSDMPFDGPGYAKLEDVLDENLSLSSSDLSGGFTRFGLNNDGYFKTASFSASPLSVSPVPEPSTFVLLGLGGLMVFGLARRQHAKKAKQAVLV